jgi:hypothetical protein
MDRGRAAGFVMLTASACAAAPPAPAPAVNIAVAALPAPPAATPAPAPEAPPEPSADPAAAEGGCAARKDEITGLPHASEEDCEAVRDATNEYFMRCEPDVQASSRAFFGMAACLADLADAQLGALASTLPPAEKKRQVESEGDLGLAVQGYCEHQPGCGMAFASHCRASMMGCRVREIEAAQKGALERPPGEPALKGRHAYDAAARALCALPKRMWKDGKVPARCVQRELAWLEACAGPPLGCAPP